MSNTRPITQGSSVGEAKAPPSLVSKLARKLPLNLLKYWWAFGMVPCVGMSVAAMMSAKMAETSYSFTSTLLYSGIPIDSVAKKLYLPPDLKTMCQFIKSPVVLQQVRDELQLAVPPSALASMIGVDEPKSMQKIGLSLGWSDEEQGRLILDKAMEVYCNNISETRRNVVGRFLTDIQKSMEVNATRLANAQRALREFNTRANVRDAETDLQILLQSIGSMEFKLESETRRIENLNAQRQNVEDRLNKQKEDQAREAEEENANAAAEESLADNRRRQDRLNELIEEERRLNEVRGVLFARQQEFERKAKLYERGFISKADFEEVDAEVKALSAKIMEGDKITAWKKELEILDQQIVPTDSKKNKGSPIITQTLYKLVELELDMLDSRTECNQLTVDLIDKRQQVRKLQELEQESTQLAKEITAAGDERDDLNSKIASLRAIHDYGPYEFSVVSPATSAMSYPSSNKKKLFLMIFVGITGALGAPFVLVAVVASFKQTVDEGCTDRNIPILSPAQSLLELLTESNADRAKELYNWNRRVGLSLQQSIESRGAVVTFLPSTHRHRDMELISSMAGILAERDENVLVIEVCPPKESEELDYRRRMLGHHEDHISTVDALLWMVTREFGKVPDGLFDYLGGNIDSDEGLINRIDGSRCHLIHAGNKYCHFDRVFSRRMSDLLGKCRQEYSIVLMYGPELNRSVDVEMLCRHSDGVMVLYDRGEPLSQDVRLTLDHLTEIGMPIYGAANRPIAFTAPASPGLFAKILARLTPLFAVMVRRYKTRPPLLGRIASAVVRPFVKIADGGFNMFKRKLVQWARSRSAAYEPAPAPLNENVQKTTGETSTEQSCSLAGEKGES